jgi:hypothetical protein
MHRGLSLLCLLCACLVACAQAPVVEYGQPGELRGINKIFLDTGTDLKQRALILAELAKEKKELPDLVVLDAPDQAEAILVFTTARERELVTMAANPQIVPGTPSGATPIYRRRLIASGYVFIPKGADRRRILLDYKESAPERKSTRLASGFAQSFIKAYRAANQSLEQNKYFRLMTGQPKS